MTSEYIIVAILAMIIFYRQLYWPFFLFGLWHAGQLLVTAGLTPVTAGLTPVTAVVAASPVTVHLLLNYSAPLRRAGQRTLTTVIRRCTAVDNQPRTDHEREFKPDLDTDSVRNDLQSPGDPDS